MASNEDDLQASKTEGYKLGEKKTVEEYAKLGRCYRNVRPWYRLRTNGPLCPRVNSLGSESQINYPLSLVEDFNANNLIWYRSE